MMMGQRRLSESRRAGVFVYGDKREVRGVASHYWRYKTKTLVSTELTRVFGHRWTF